MTWSAARADEIRRDLSKQADSLKNLCLPAGENHIILDGERRSDMPTENQGVRILSGKLLQDKPVCRLEGAGSDHVQD